MPVVPAASLSSAVEEDIEAVPALQARQARLVAEERPRRYQQHERAVDKLTAAQAPALTVSPPEPERISILTSRVGVY